MKVLLIRANRNEVDAAALAKMNIASCIDPYLRITPVTNETGVERIRTALTSSKKTWLIVTSTNALSFLEEAMLPGELRRIISTTPSLMFAAIGAQTETELRERGANRVLRPRGATAGALAIELCATEPCAAVIPSGSIAMRGLRNRLKESGFQVISEVIYATTSVFDEPPSVKAISAGEISAVLLRSPSAARAFHKFNKATNLDVFCAGQTTADEALALGLHVVGVADNPSPETIAQMISQHGNGQT